MGVERWRQRELAAEQMDLSLCHGQCVVSVDCELSWTVPVLRPVDPQLSLIGTVSFDGALDRWDLKMILMDQNPFNL